MACSVHLGTQEAALKGRPIAIEVTAGQLGDMRAALPLLTALPVGPVRDALESFADIVNLLVPELQRRGVYQTEYSEGTLRQKLFGRSPRLPEEHPAAFYRVRHQLPVLA